MKKILYILLSAVLAIVFSSYTPAVDNIEKQTTKDTVLVKVDVKQSPRYQKGDESIYKQMTQALESYVRLNESKQILLEDVMQEESTSVLEMICQDVGITSDELFKRARADTLIKFITSIVLIVLLGLGLYIIIQMSSSNHINWQNSVVVIVGYFILVYLLETHLYNTLSYIFNSNYLQIKEIITLIK